MFRLQQPSAIRTESLLVKLSIRIHNLSFVNTLRQAYNECFMPKVFQTLCYSRLWMCMSRRGTYFVSSHTPYKITESCP